MLRCWPHRRSRAPRDYGRFDEPSRKEPLVTIGGDGKHTYLIHIRNSDGSIIKALMVEDGHRIATRYIERIVPDLIADIETLLGDKVPDHDAIRDKVYKALHQVLVNVRVPSAQANHAG